MHDLREEVGDNILIEALGLTTGDRHHSYGPPTKNFSVTAALWGEYLEAKQHPFPITTVDVSVLMQLLKIARLAESPLKRDHMVDIAGYAACGAQCQDEERELNSLSDMVAAQFTEDLEAEPMTATEVKNAGILTIEKLEEAKALLQNPDCPPAMTSGLDIIANKPLPPEIEDMRAALEKELGQEVTVRKVSPDQFTKMLEAGFTEIPVPTKTEIRQVGKYPGGIYATPTGHEGLWDPSFDDGGTPLLTWDPKEVKAKLRVQDGKVMLDLEGPLGSDVEVYSRRAEFVSQHQHPITGEILATLLIHD